MRIWQYFAFLSGAVAASSAFAESYKVGDTVQCDPMHINLYRTGKVIAIEPRPGWPDPFYRVHLEGDSDSSLCAEKVMKAASALQSAVPQAQPVQTSSPAQGAQATTSASPLCVQGNKLEAAMGISWYAATVLAPPDANGKCLVHYDGYPSLYDIPVGPTSLRPTGSGPIIKPNRPIDEAAASVGGSDLKVGEYACYGSGGSVLAGLGFKVVRAGRYTDLDGKSSGTYRIAGDTITFSGGHLDGQSGRNLKANGQFVTHQYVSCEPWQ